MSLEADNTYKAPIETAISSAKDILEGSVGLRSVDIGKEVDEAIGSIQSKQKSLIEDIEKQYPDEKKDAIARGLAMEPVNRLAEQAIHDLEANKWVYETRHEAHVTFTSEKARIAAEEGAIWGVVNGIEGARGAVNPKEFSITITSGEDLQKVEQNLRDLKAFSDQAKHVRFNILEPASKSLGDILQKLGKVDPELEATILEYKRSVDDKIGMIQETEGWYEQKLNDVRGSLADQAEREREKLKSMQTQLVRQNTEAVELRRQNKPAKSAERADLSEAINKQKGLVEWLDKKYPQWLNRNADVSEGGPLTIEYGEQEKQVEQNTGDIGV